MSVLYLALGSTEELREQIIGLAIDRAFLIDPLPTDACTFRRRIDEGRGRLTLIANEIARTSHAVLVDHSAAVRKLKDSRASKEVSEDIEAQLARLVPKRFLQATPWPQLAHLPRFLKGVVMRLDKWRADPARDAARLAELRPIEQRYLRAVAERKGVRDVRLDEFRWLIEDLRISLFAQELRTPQPVSAKRLEKAWSQMTR
jgi:ATP-dependent helicase HrpA